MNARNCYCPVDGAEPDHYRAAGLPSAYCGVCQVCSGPGHTRHHPGHLPFTGSWCDTHFDAMAAAFEAGLAPDEPYALRDIGRRCFRVPRLFTRRLWFGREKTTDGLLEYRSDLLARYVLLDRRGRPCGHGQRWCHPLGMWVHPFSFELADDWEEIEPRDFERLWHTAASQGGRRGRA